MYDHRYLRMLNRSSRSSLFFFSAESPVGIHSFSTAKKTPTTIRTVMVVMVVMAPIAIARLILPGQTAA